MKLYIRNMVCNRCKAAVRNELEKLSLSPVSIELGEVTLAAPPTPEKYTQLNQALKTLGFEIIDDRKSRIIEQIKNIIIDMIHHAAEEPAVNLSVLLSAKLNYDYNYLSNIFSEVEGITIEKYLIAQKIEKVKELMMYDELSLSQIADRLGYSSVAYLSNQFKKQTGLSPSFYKSMKQNLRRNLDEV
ncbi:MAG TPA: AraC family transcriptional regulator [Niabella sp.]